MNTLEKIKLPNCTLIALTGIYYKPEEHIHAIEKSCEGIEFGAVKIVMDSKVSSVDSWNKFIVFDLWKYVDTEFAFLFHADGYITNPDLWNPKWLEYDYCGAPWPLPKDDFSYRDIYGSIQRMGNSVGLRSRKLLKLATDLNLEWKAFHGFTHEDGWFCVNMRHIYEQHGCRFMPFEESLDFGREYELPEHKERRTFCFHQAL